MKLSDGGLTLREVTDKDIKEDGSVDIPELVTSIADRAFSSCSKLKSILIDCVDIEQHARIFNLLPDEVKKHAIPFDLAKEIIGIKKQVTENCLIDYSLGVSQASKLPFDMAYVVAQYNNIDISNLISQVELPKTENVLEAYKNKIEAFLKNALGQVKKN